MNCTFDPSRSPYKYFDPDGNVLLEGISVNVTTVPLPNKQPDTIELCVYNTSACLSDNKLDCCEETDSLFTYSTTVTFVTFAIGYVLSIFFMRCSGIKKRWGVTGSMGFAAMYPKKPGIRLPMTKWQMAKAVMFALLCICVIVAQWVEGFILPLSIQTTLTPADRTSQLAMRSFLSPIEEIFSFLEDTMTVKVGYAIAGNNLKELNALLHIGVLGGACSGILAFLFTIFIAFFHGTSAAVLNPSHASNQVLIDGGCSLIPTTDQMTALTHTYWIFMTLSWIPNFATKSITGFFIGAGHFIPLVFSSIVFCFC